MSYILDALKLSDQDRKKGDVPNIHSQPDELVPASTVSFKRSRMNLLLSLFLPMLAVLLVWVFSRSMNIDTSSPSTPVTAATSDRNPSVDVSSMDENIAPQQEDIFGDDVYLDELKDVRLDISPVDEVDVPVSQASTVEESAVHPPDPLLAATDERVVESEPPPEPPQSGSDAIERTISTEPIYDSDPYLGILSQRQLPYDLQKALPDMNISVHSYSVEPSLRLVRINKMIYHEGDFIDVELKLEEITRDGLIMSIRDNRFWRYVR